jgi:hypothetical protein
MFIPNPDFFLSRIQGLKKSTGSRIRIRSTATIMTQKTTTDLREGRKTKKAPVVRRVKSGNSQGLEDR